MGGAVLMFAITDRKRSREFAAWFQGQQIPLVLATPGQGTATTEATEKVVLMLVAPQSRELVRRAERDLWLDVPGRGILMTVPLSSIGGARAKNYLLKQEGEVMEQERTHELIVVITNGGRTDQVMDAARSAGAGGGTSIHAKGTGTALAKKFFGVTLSAEKEIVFILTEREKRNPIMKAIMDQAGMQTDAQSLAFSLPVNDIAGLRRLDLQDRS